MQFTSFEENYSFYYTLFFHRKSVSSDSVSDSLDMLYKDNSDLLQFRGENLTSDIVSAWYLTRAREIEEDSNFVDTALDLLKLGRERNIPVSNIIIILKIG